MINERKFHYQVHAMTVDAGIVKLCLPVFTDPERSIVMVGQKMVEKQLG